MSDPKDPTQVNSAPPSETPTEGVPLGEQLPAVKTNETIPEVSDEVKQLSDLGIGSFTATPEDISLAQSESGVTATPAELGIGEFKATPDEMVRAGRLQKIMERQEKAIPAAPMRLGFALEHPLDVMRANVNDVMQQTTLSAGQMIKGIGDLGTIVGLNTAAMVSKTAQDNYDAYKRGEWNPDNFMVDLGNYLEKESQVNKYGTANVTPELEAWTFRKTNQALAMLMTNLAVGGASTSTKLAGAPMGLAAMRLAPEFTAAAQFAEMEKERALEGGSTVAQADVVYGGMLPVAFYMNRILGTVPIFKNAAELTEGNVAPTMWNVLQRMAVSSAKESVKTGASLGLQTGARIAIGSAIGAETAIDQQTGEVRPKTFQEQRDEVFSAIGTGMIMGAVTGPAFRGLNIADSRAAYQKDVGDFKSWYSNLENADGQARTPQDVALAEKAFSIVYPLRQEAFAAAYKASEDPTSPEFKAAFTNAFNQGAGRESAKPVLEQIYTRVADEMGKMAERDFSKASGGTALMTAKAMGTSVSNEVKTTMSAEQAKVAAEQEQEKIETTPTPAAEVPAPKEAVKYNTEVGQTWDYGRPEKVVSVSGETTLPEEYTVTTISKVYPNRKAGGLPEVDLIKRNMTPEEIVEKQRRLQEANDMAKSLGMPETPIPDAKPVEKPVAVVAEPAPKIVEQAPPLPETKPQQPAPVAKEVIPSVPKKERQGGPKLIPENPEPPVTPEEVKPAEKPVSLAEQVAALGAENARLKAEQAKKPEVPVTTPEAKSAVPQPGGDMLEQIAANKVPPTPETPEEVVSHEARPETGGVKAAEISGIKTTEDAFPLLRQAISRLAEGKYVQRARELMNRFLTEGKDVEAEQAREIAQSAEAQEAAVKNLKKEGIDLSDKNQYDRIVVEKNFGRDIAAPENSKGGQAPVEESIINHLAETKGNMNFIERAIGQHLYKWGIVESLDEQIARMSPDVQNEIRIAVRENMANRQAGEFTPEEANKLLNTAVDRVASRYSRIYKALQAFGLDQFAEHTLGEAAVANVVEPESGSVLQAEREVHPQENDFAKFGESLISPDDKIALQTYGREEANQGAVSAQELRALQELYQKLASGKADTEIQALYERAKKDIDSFDKEAPLGRGRKSQIEDALDLAKRFGIDPAAIMAVSDRGQHLADLYRQEQISKFNEFNVVLRPPDEEGRKRMPVVGPPPPKKIGVLGMAKAKVAKWFGVKIETNVVPANIDLNEFQTADDKFGDDVEAVNTWMRSKGLNLRLISLNAMARKTFDGWSFIRMGWVDSVTGKRSSAEAPDSQWYFVNKNGDMVLPSQQEYVLVNSQTGEYRQEILPYSLSPEEAIATANERVRVKAERAYQDVKDRLTKQNQDNEALNAKNAQAKNKKPVLSEEEINQRAEDARNKALSKVVDTAKKIFSVGQSNHVSNTLSEFYDVVPLEEGHTLFDDADAKTKEEWKTTWNSIHDRLEPNYRILAKSFAVQMHSNLPIFAAHYLTPRPLANMPGLTTLTMHVPDVKAADGSPVLENNDLNHVPGAQNITAWVTGYETTAIDPVTNKTKKVFYLLEIQRAKGFRSSEDEYNPRLTQALGQHLPPKGSPEAESGEYQSVNPMQGGGRALWSQMFEQVAKYAQSKGMDIMIPDAENALRIQGYYDPSGESYKLQDATSRTAIEVTREGRQEAITRPEVSFLRSYYDPSEAGSIHEMAEIALGKAPAETVVTHDQYEPAAGHHKIPGDVGGILYRSENFEIPKKAEAPAAEPVRASYPEPGSNGRITTEEIHPDDVHPEQKPMVEAVIRKAKMLMPNTKVVFTRITDGDPSDPLTFSATAYHPDKDVVTVNITALQALYENGQSGKSLGEIVADPQFNAFLHFALLHEKTHQAISKNISAKELGELWDSLTPTMKNALIREYYQLPEGTELKEGQKIEAGNEYLRRAYELVSTGKTSEEMVQAIGTPKVQNWFVRIVRQFASMLSKNLVDNRYNAEITGISNNPKLLESINLVDSVVREQAADAGHITFNKENIKRLFDRNMEEQLRVTRDAINRGARVVSNSILQNGAASLERVLEFINPELLRNLPVRPSAELIFSVANRKLNDPEFSKMLDAGLGEFIASEKNTATGQYELVRRTVSPDDIETWLAKATSDEVGSLVDVVKSRQTRAAGVAPEEAPLGTAPLKRRQYGTTFYMPRAEQGGVSRSLEELNNGGKLRQADIESIAKARGVAGNAGIADAYAKLLTPGVKQIAGSPAAKLLALLGHDAYEGGGYNSAFDERMATEVPQMHEALSEATAPLGMSKMTNTPQIGLVANFKKWMQKKFTSKGMLTDYEDVFTAIASRSNDVDAAMARVSYNNDKLGASVKEAEKSISKSIPDKAAAKQEQASLHGVIDLALKDKTNRVAWDYLESNYPKLAENLYDMRSHIDRLSLELAGAGFISEGLQGTILENLGVYLNRSYRIHDIDPSSNKSQWAENMKRVMVGDIHEGSKEDLAMEHILNDMRNYGFNWLAEKKAATWANFVDYLKDKKVSDPAAYANVPLGGKPLVEFMASQRGKAELSKFSNEIKRGEASYGGKDIAVAPVEVETLLGDLLDLTEKDIQEAISTGKIAKNIGRTVGILQQRKNLPLEIRALWGEYTEAEALYPKTVQKLSGLIANDKLVNSVHSILSNPEGLYGKMVFESREEALRAGFKNPVRLFPDSEKRYGPLAGAFGPEFLRDALVDATDRKQIDTATKVTMSIVGTALAAKTTLSLQAGIRNFIGNIVPALSNGYFFNSGVWARLGKATAGARNEVVDIVLDKFGRDKESAQGYYEKLLRLGVIDENVTVGILKDISTDISRLNVHQSGAERMGSYIFEKTAGIRKHTDSWYQAMDNFWKVFAFETEFANHRAAYPDRPIGDIEKLAAQKVRDVTFTYALTPQFTKDLRRSIIGVHFAPFMAFTLEVIRTNKNIFKYSIQEMKEGLATNNDALATIGAKRLMGALVGHLAIIGAVEAISKMQGVDDDEEKAIRRFLPSWQKASMLMPLSIEKGAVTLTDVSFTNPWAYFYQPFIALARTDEGTFTKTLIASLAKIAEPFTNPQIFTRAVMEATLGRTMDSQNGRAIYLEGDSAQDKLAKGVAHVWKAIEPGTITSARRIGAGVLGTESKTGRVYDPAIEITSTLTGLRIQKIDVAKSLSNSGYNFSNNIQAATRVLNDTIYPKGATTEDAVTHAYVQADDVRFLAYQTLYRDVMAARKLGVADTEIRRVLKTAGINDVAMVDVLRGVYRQIVPNKAAVEKLSALPDKMVRLQGIRIGQSQVPMTRAMEPQ